ncbi:hypothetical protein BUE80_DR007168 [Diplocarpon rosae]|nr:hypothetical protein BUE80_DR007168 [Diplocarpon rosae]
MALVAYRNVLRSTRLAFSGDIELIRAARIEARNAFRKNAALTAADPQLGPAIAHAKEVAKILRENVVQGKLDENGKYKLRIHEHTERGDNDTIRMPSGQKVVIDGKKCSDK